MSLKYQIIAWVSLLLVIGLFLWIFRGILLPFVLGIGLAYLLNPPVTWLAERNIHRGLATLAVMAMFLLLVIVAILLVVPVLVQQGIGLARNLPGYFEQLQGFVETQIPRLEQWLGPQRMEELQRGLDQMFSDVIGVVTNLTGQVMQSGVNLIGTLSVVIVTPVVAVYMLIDWQRMVAGVNGLLPPKYKGEIRSVLDEMDVALGGFLRGQGAVLLILAVYYGVALSLAGLHFGLAIGIITGLFSFIPYLGSFLGFLLSIGVGLVQFWPDPLMISLIAAIYMFGQLFESYFLYPKLVGSSIRLHPVWMMFAIFAFAVLFGLVGVLMAVPLAAISGVLMRWAVAKYRLSPLYRSDPVIVTSALAAPPKEDDAGTGEKS
ncbi:AI-2E family transporter [Pelagibacterium limicola]|uniref:AI-2E family transporter n=1 Tax=Pelagibacterium limicola TaxID=2791022 RepID=UPI0018AFD050|nr:AI-2E family transporter [Pelagibacterium limicola]